MSGKSDYFENALLRLIFNATAMANGIARNGTGGTDLLYVALHTANPSDTGNQTTAEATYTGYARVAVPRTTAGWTVTGNIVRPTANILFPESTGGIVTVTHFSVGTVATGSSDILYYGQVNPVVTITSGIRPILNTTSTITEE